MMSEDKTFPIQKGYAGDKAAPGPLRIPWSIAEIAYCAYARMYGTGQSLERLAERGGFGLGEMDALYPQWRNEVSEIAVLKQRITGLEHENAALTAQVERLKAPVSDEELQPLHDKYGYFKYGDAQGDVSRKFVNDLLSARTAAPVINAVQMKEAMLKAQIKQLEDSRFALAVAHTEDVLTIERLRSRSTSLRCCSTVKS
jgi:cell division protein FtsB